MAFKAAYDFRREVERVVLEHGGVIFGGHVRDLILQETSHPGVRHDMSFSMT
jgi:hypothetical protein